MTNPLDTPPLDTPPPGAPPLGDHVQARATLKAIPAVRAITRAWRGLTDGGAPTFVACSGGADSVALGLSLWSIKAPITLGHIVHDLRPEAEARADRDFTKALAEGLGLAFRESAVRVVGAGNDEANARQRRYAALDSIAREAGIRFVASAHHADDQLESMLMAIARGAGLEGLSGIAPSRPIGGSLGGSLGGPLGNGVTLIRPMLSATRAEAESICRAVGVGWAHDATNDDTDRFRSAVRAGPGRLLREIRPAAPLGAVRAGELLRDAALLITDRALAVFGEALVWERSALRPERAVVLGAGLRAASLGLTDGRGADLLSRRVIDPVVRAIRDDSTEPRYFHWPSRIEVTVTAARIEMFRSDLRDGKGVPDHA